MLNVSTLNPSKNFNFLIFLKKFYFNNLKISSEEDKFVLYASLKSGHNTHIVSNDTFTNFICRLNGSFDIFKQWLTNRRIEYRMPLNAGHNQWLKVFVIFLFCF